MVLLSYEIRSHKSWPCNLYAQYMWGLRSMLEDINELLIAHDQAIAQQGRITLLRYALVALHAFDDLVGQFQSDLRSAKLVVPHADDRKRLIDALASYHRLLEPARSDLAAIRHTLGAHRGLPGVKEQKRFRKQFKAWGEWESTLTALEERCERSRWQATLEAAFDLHHTINDVDLGQWYSSGGGKFRLYTPFRLMGMGGRSGDHPDAPHNPRVQRTHSRVTPLAEERKRRATRPRR